MSLNALIFLCKFLKWSYLLSLVSEITKLNYGETFENCKNKHTMKYLMEMWFANTIRSKQSLDCSKIKANLTRRNIIKI